MDFCPPDSVAGRGNDYSEKARRDHIPAHKMKTRKVSVIDEALHQLWWQRVAANRWKGPTATRIFWCYRLSILFIANRQMANANIVKIRLNVINRLHGAVDPNM